MTDHDQPDRSAHRSGGGRPRGCSGRSAGIQPVQGLIPQRFALAEPGRTATSGGPPDHEPVLRSRQPRRSDSTRAVRNASSPRLETGGTPGSGSSTARSKSPVQAISTSGRALRAAPVPSFGAPSGRASRREPIRTLNQPTGTSSPSPIREGRSHPEPGAANNPLGWPKLSTDPEPTSQSTATEQIGRAHV